MKKYLQFNSIEALCLVVIFLSWILLICVKRGVFYFIETLSFPLSLFWMGTGAFVSVFFFKKIMKRKESPWKISWKALPLTICALISYQLYFFHKFPMSQENRPYFFMWVPILYWVLSMIFYGGRKDLITFRLLALAIFVCMLLFGNALIPMIASLFFTAFALMAFNKQAPLLLCLLQGAALQILISGAFSFFYWQESGSVRIEAIYGALGGGFLLGLSILLFLHAFRFLRIRISTLGICLCLLTDLAIPLEGKFVILFCFPLLFIALVTLHFVTLIVEKKGSNQEALPTHLLN